MGYGQIGKAVVFGAIIVGVRVPLPQYFFWCSVGKVTFLRSEFRFGQVGLSRARSLVVEHWAFNLTVLGSNPNALICCVWSRFASGVVGFRGDSLVVERQPVALRYAGSIPVLLELTCCPRGGGYFVVLGRPYAVWGPSSSSWLGRCLFTAITRVRVSQGAVFS